VRVKLVALLAVHDDPDARLAALGRGDPRAILERRAMAHVLTVAALEFRDPVPFVVLREARNVAFHDLEAGLKACSYDT
jgi:hypothetical protein